MGNPRLKKTRILSFLTERSLSLRTVTSDEEVTVCFYLEGPGAAGIVFGALKFDICCAFFFVKGK